MIHWLHRLLQFAVGGAGAYGGLVFFWVVARVVPNGLMGWLSNNGIPLPNHALLPFMAFVFLAFATTGALVAVVLLRYALRPFNRRLAES